MRKELGPINARIPTVLVDGSGDRPGTVRDVVGERVARVVGGLQQQQEQQRRQGLTVIVGSSPQTETETPPCSAVGPPPSPSPSPSPSSAHSPSAVEGGKLGNRVNESRSKISSSCGFHKQWWQRWPADMLGPHWVYRRRRKLMKKKRSWTPGEHMVVSFARRLQRIEQRIRKITKRYEMLNYERVAEKYVQWENHLREQMLIRSWGTRKNAELDRERRRDGVRLACLRRRREALVRLVV